MLKKDSRLVMGLHLHKFGVSYFRPKILKIISVFQKKKLKKIFIFKKSTFNPYRQIPETISKKRAMIQGFI